MKNSVATIVTGLAAQQTYGKSIIEATVERPYDFDSRITGATSEDTIDVRMLIPVQDNTFQARKTNGRWNGTQDKLLFDWNIKQTDNNTYEIDRVGINGTLHLYMNGRNITGTFEMPYHLDYSFSGSISETGAYSLTLNLPLQLDWAIKGTIKPR